MCTCARATHTHTHTNTMQTPSLPSHTQRSMSPHRTSCSPKGLGSGGGNGEETHGTCPASGWTPRVWPYGRLLMAWPAGMIGSMKEELLFVACLTSQQHASVSQGRICSDNFTCCHTEIEVADQTFYLTQSQYTDTVLTL